MVLVIGMSVQTKAGWFCRNCGTTIFREQTKATLTLGWWGIPAVATPIFLLINLSQRENVSRLPAPRFPPVPPEGAGPRYGHPLPPETPVRRSPAVIVPIVLIGLVLFLCQAPSLFS
jgi:hypothetical protein